MKKIITLILFLSMLIFVSCGTKTPTPETTVTDPTVTLNPTPEVTPTPTPEVTPTEGEKEPTENTEVLIKATAVINGGFETADLSGWTVLSGNAFTNDSVSSRGSFSYPEDKYHNEIPINQTGNWYLTSKGFDLSYSNYRTGIIKSSNFYLKEDGIIKFKLAGGALKESKGQNAADKAKEKLCYLGIYRAKDDMMIAQQTNEYFLEHTEDYVDVKKYENGVYNTQNFYQYNLINLIHIDRNFEYYIHHFHIS